MSQSASRADVPACFCPACERPVVAFLPGPGGRPNARCPHCQALERHRMLLLILRSHGYLFIPPARALDVAPARQVRHFLESKLGDRYVATDLFPDLDPSVQSDLTKLPFANASFDVAVCYHVFEHIPDDHAAMSEVARVLRPGGLLFVQVPRKSGVLTAEDPSAPPEERVRRFGQDDHVRLYGEDLESRFKAAGLHPSTIKPAAKWPKDQIRRFGLQQEEELWICRQADPSYESGIPGRKMWFTHGLDLSRGRAPFRRRARRWFGGTVPGRIVRKILRPIRGSRRG
jgi:SAM-dependent methyltransferase